MEDLIDRIVQLISQQSDNAEHVADWCCKRKAFVFWGGGGGGSSFDFKFLHKSSC